MAYVKAQFQVPQYVDANGDPVTGYKQHFFITGTSTRTPVYSDPVGTALSDGVTVGVVEFNSLGQPQTAGGTSCDIYLDTTVVYKYQLYDVSGSAVGPTVDPYYPLGLGSAQTVDSFAEAYATAFTGIDAVITRSFYGSWSGATAGPKGGATYHRDGTTGTASTAYADNSGFYDANGDGFKIHSSEPNPFQFGAYGDGTTDDTDAIHNAIANYDTVFFPEAAFAVTGIYVEGIPYLNLQSRGATLTLLDNSNLPVIKTYEVDEVVVNGFTIDGNKDNQDVSADRNNGCGIAVWYAYIARITNNNTIDTSGGGGILYIAGGRRDNPARIYSKFILIENNVIEQPGKLSPDPLSDGIYFNGDNGFIRNNTLLGYTDYGIAHDFCRDVTIENNISDAQVRGFIGLGGVGNLRTKIRNNVITSCTRGIVLLDQGVSGDENVDCDIIGNDIRDLGLPYLDAADNNGISNYASGTVINCKIQNNTIDSGTNSIAVTGKNAVVSGNICSSYTNRPLSGFGVTGGTYTISNNITEHSITDVVAAFGGDGFVIDGTIQGLWTPTINGDATGVISASSAGQFLKTGNLVHVEAQFTVTSNFTSNSIGGLPYQPRIESTISNAYGLQPVASSISGAMIYARVIDTDTIVQFYSGDAVTAHAPSTTGVAYRFFLTYYTDE